MAQIALAYAGLPDIDMAPPLDALDQDCLDEIRAVLKKHKKLDRFGVCLLHGHFLVKSDEIMLESCDVDKRELTIRPVSLSVIPEKQLRETMWRLGDSTATQVCMMSCVANGSTGRHERKHVKFPG